MDIKTIKKYYKMYHDELYQHVIPFWTGNAIDRKYGGVFTCLDRKGRIYSTDKSVWFQGRCAWTFSNLNNVYGENETWLSIAKNCLDFATNYCIDKTDGRMYFTVTEEGKPIRKRRYFASEEFYILGNAEYSLATGDKESLEIARKYFDFVCSIYDDPSADPYKITPKTILETRRLRSLGGPMTLIDVCNCMCDADPENAAKYSERSKSFISDVLRYHYKEDLKALLENVWTDGSFLDYSSVGRIINPGHDLEASWFILREAVRLNDNQLLKIAQNIYDWAMERGWDKTYGGIFYFVDALGHPPEQYEHDMKLWWPHNEAIIASLMLYQQTGDQRYWRDFEMLTEYSFNAFSDHEYGEWYGYLRRDGKPTEPACKGSTYKGPYHLPRMLILVDKILEKLCKEDI